MGKDGIKEVGVGGVSGGDEGWIGVMEPILADEEVDLITKIVVIEGD